MRIYTCSIHSNNVEPDPGRMLSPSAAAPLRPLLIQALENFYLCDDEIRRLILACKSADARVQHAV